MQTTASKKDGYLFLHGLSNSGHNVSILLLEDLNIVVLRKMTEFNSHTRTAARPAEEKVRVATVVFFGLNGEASTYVLVLAEQVAIIFDAELVQVLTPRARGLLLMQGAGKARGLTKKL